MPPRNCLVAVAGAPNLTQTSANGGAFLWLEAFRRTEVLHELPVAVVGTQGLRRRADAAGDAVAERAWPFSAKHSATATWGMTRSMSCACLK